MKKLLNMNCSGATKHGLVRSYVMARKPDEKPDGEHAVKRMARKNHDELAGPGTPRSPKGPHCGDMGLASREKQFRPGTGGR
jgi:hypothetical protein